jgi:hypothetical protein
MNSNLIKAIAISFLVVSALMSGVQAELKNNKDSSGSQTQPQGNTGPLNTKSGGAPAASPQGETPAGMQSAPKGSSETIRTDTSGKPEGTPKD